ncbi:MAG: sulfatase [Candidatus Aminicenantales bacterium]
MIRRTIRRLRWTIPCVLVAAALSGPACRPRPASNPVSVRFLDRLTAAAVVESPLKNPDAARREGVFPAGSDVLSDIGSGPDILGLKRKLNAGKAEMDVLFAPPRSVFSFRLPAQAAGFLDFGIGIVRDGAPTAPVDGGEEPSGGVTFLVTLENRDGKKTLFEQLLPPPKIKRSRTVIRSRHKIPVPASSGETTLTFQTTGNVGEFGFWSNPVFYVPQKAPVNVILVSIDTLRADHLGTYGYDRPVSPFIDALAADAAVFENTYTTAPWTLPAHVSMFTGLNCVRHRVYDEYARIDPRTVTLAEKMRAAGYATGAITGGGLVSAEYGLAKGFDEYRMEYGERVDPTQADKIGRDAVQWLEQNADRPFYLFLHTYQVHLPYKSPEPFRSQFLPPGARWKTFTLEKNLGGLAGVFRPLGEADRANVVALYDAGIRYTDEALIKPVVDALRRLGLYDRSLIVVTSDHGEEFYDHGGWDHTHSVYEELIRVPLIVKLPGSEFRGRRYSPIVRTIDIMPTVLDAAGIPFGELSLNGAGLGPVLRGKETADRAFLVELSDNVYNCRIPPRLAVNDGRRKLILNHPFRPDELNFFLAPPPEFPSLEIYDLGRDPKEKQNLAGRPDEAARDRALVQKAREFERLIPPRGNERTKIDKDLEDQLRALGYIK